MHATIVKAMAAAALAFVGLQVAGAASRWASETDKDIGLRYSYPPDVFLPIEGDEKPSFHYFVSASSDAKFLVGGWHNAEGQSPSGFRQWLIDNAGGYDELTYRPGGRTWFVLSGYRGDSIFYEKVIFSCGGSLVNVFAVTYPVQQRDLYDQIVERMEDKFRPGNRCAPKH